jgi:hypothetical protein
MSSGRVPRRGVPVLLREKLEKPHGRSGLSGKIASLHIPTISSLSALSFLFFFLLMFFLSHLKFPFGLLVSKCNCLP